MAAVKDQQKTSIILKVETGTAAGGSAIYSNRTFSKIAPAATDTNLLSFANALGALQIYPVGTVLRRDEAILVEE